MMCLTISPQKRYNDQNVLQHTKFTHNSQAIKT